MSCSTYLVLSVTHFFSSQWENFCVVDILYGIVNDKSYLVTDSREAELSFVKKPACVKFCERLYCVGLLMAGIPFSFLLKYINCLNSGNSLTPFMKLISVFPVQILNSLQLKVIINIKRAVETFNSGTASTQNVKP